MTVEVRPQPHTAIGEAATRPALEDLVARSRQLPADVKTYPVYRELLADLETPVSAYLKISDGGRLPGFLLESVEGGRRIARYSFLGTEPMARTACEERTTRPSSQLTTTHSSPGSFSWSRSIDVAQVNGEVFINNSSIGIYPYMVLDRERRRATEGRPKWSAMILAFLRMLRHFPRRRLRVTAEGWCLPFTAGPAG